MTLHLRAARFFIHTPNEVGASKLDPPHLNSDPGHTTVRCVTLDKLLYNFLICNKDKLVPNLVGLLWRINEIIHVKCMAQCLFIPMMGEELKRSTFYSDLYQ